MSMPTPIEIQAICTRIDFQLNPLQFQGQLMSGRLVVKIIAESIHNMIRKHIVVTLLSGIRVE
jgi:hypothetical protein